MDATTSIEIRLSPDGRAIHARLGDQPPVDVTEAVLTIVCRYIGPGHTLGLKSAGKTVMQISVARPEVEPVNGS